METKSFYEYELDNYRYVVINARGIRKDEYIEKITPYKFTPYSFLFYFFIIVISILLGINCLFNIIGIFFGYPLSILGIIALTYTLPILATVIYSALQGRDPFYRIINIIAVIDEWLNGKFLRINLRERK